VKQLKEKGIMAKDKKAAIAKIALEQGLPLQETWLWSLLFFVIVMSMMLIMMMTGNRNYSTATKRQLWTWHHLSEWWSVITGILRFTK